MTSSGSELIDAVSGSGRAAAAVLRRRRSELVVWLAVLVTVLVAIALAGSVLDDRSIEGHRVVTAAEVLDDPTFGRTLVRFALPDGQAVVPERGVLHPRGLTAGTTILVEYDAANPELVRVAGRSTLDALGVTAAGLAGMWVLLGALAWWLRPARRERPRPR